MSKKKQDYRNISIEELVRLLRQNKKQLFSLRLQKALGDLKNTSLCSRVRKDVARISTVISQREKLDIEN